MTRSAHRRQQNQFRRVGCRTVRLGHSVYSYGHTDLNTKAQNRNTKYDTTKSSYDLFNPYDSTKFTRLGRWLTKAPDRPNPHRKPQPPKEGIPRLWVRLCDDHDTESFDSKKQIWWLVPV
eukprot:c17105_g1_i2.p2 GENE.c17105_g1_i2~~c17105_g1_i2.p2  ORF type:complete len:120 (+),score=2.34 c17105_g1_i2:92-451(+)